MNERRSPGESAALWLDSITVLLRVVRQTTLPTGQRPSPCYENPKRSSSGLPRTGRPFLIFATMGCLAAGGLWTFGCSGSRAEGSRPEPALAASPEAQRDFRILREQWRRTAPSDRSKLEPSARAFLKAHPDDGRAPLVRIYLALVLMDQNRLAEARRVLGPLEQTPVGTTRDFAHVAKAALLLSEGKPKASRLELEPLRGKLIDAGERLLYGELLVKSALAEDHLADAVLDMRWWLNEVEPSDVAEVQGRVQGYLQRFDRGELEQARAWLVRDKSSRQASQAIDAWLEQQLTQLLVHSAVRDQDSALARRLLKSASTEIGDATTRDTLRQLATGGELTRRIVGRTIGLVLSLGTPRTRVRSSQLSAGVTQALGLPQAASDPDTVKLLVENDAEGMEAALGSLAGAGASILIAGVDEQGAAQAATFAETAAIVVIVATHVEGGADDWEYAFSVGEPLETQRSVLEGALRREGSRHWVEVNWEAGGASCANQLGSAGSTRFPVAQWRRSGADALLLLGDERCSLDVIEEVRGSRRFKFALGLESAVLLAEAEASGTTIFVRAGTFPPDIGASPGEASAADRWYEALGRDAARLAQSALAPFPSETVDDARIVAELHTRARDRLLSTTVKLETSHQDGFAGQHQLPRELRPVVGKGRNSR